MTKAELIEILKGYPDDTCIEVVRAAVHYDISCAVPYNDHGVQILELGIFDQKTEPESVKRKNNVT